MKYQEIDNVDIAFEKFEFAFNQLLEIVAPYPIPNGDRTGKSIWFDKTLNNSICKSIHLHKLWKKGQKEPRQIKTNTIKAKKHYYEQKS